MLIKMFQKTLLIPLIILISAQSSFAFEVTLLNQGDKAPFSGLLFPTDKAQQVQKDLLSCDKLKLINVSLQDSINIYKKNEDIYLKEISDLKIDNQDLNSAIVTQKSNSWISNTIYFGLGVLAGGLVIYAAKR